MQSFFVATTDSSKPFFLSLQNPFTALFSGTKSKKTADQSRLENTVGLQSMARDVESSQPSLAAELRYFASRS